MTSAGGERTHRVFVACALPQEVRDRAAGIQEELGGDRVRPAVRWVRPDGVHLTLRFLGLLTSTDVDSVAAALDRLGPTAPMPAFTVGGGGAFPALDRPRVLWLGVEDETGELGALAARVGDVLVEAGFERDQQRFRPHLTIGRADGSAAAARIARELVDRAALLRLRVVAGSAELVESHLGQGAARYSVLHAVPLRPGRPAHVAPTQATRNGAQ